MTTLVSSEQTEKENKSPLSSPLKLRQLLSDVFTSAEDAVTRSASVTNLVSEATCEATNQEAFFNRVKSYTCLRWTGKPRILSPLRCSQYGWINTDTDMLTCCSCQMFLCASVQPSHDFQKYKTRVLEVKQQLRTQHKEFCSWADFPSPERFCIVPLNEPEELLGGFLGRFKSVVLLQSQLPSIKMEQLKDMSLSRDLLSTVLQLVDDVKIVPEDSSSEVLNIQMTACILALCGWGASLNLNVPVLTCSYCMRKAGTWNFLTEAAFAEEDIICLPSHPSSLVPEVKSGERVPPPSSPSHAASCRMKLRSQDPMRSEQLENTPPPPLGRTRSRDSPSPVEELPRGKRPLTRSRGQGDGLASENTFSPQKKNKRPRLSSCSGSEGLLHRDVFDPLAQHRHWCPWVNGVKDEAWSLEESAPAINDPELPPAGWRASLHLLVQMKGNHRPPGTGPEEGSDDRSRRIFSIFSQ